MPTIADLTARADQTLFANQYPQALGFYTRIVELQPSNLDARLRVADSLLALGELQRAAVVYTSLARHAALCGYPLRALVSLKIVAALEPRLGVLLQDIAAMYGQDSPRLGRSVRRAPPDPAQSIADTTASARTGAELVLHAERVASTYDAADLLYPDKLIPIPLLSLLPASEFGPVLSALRLVRAQPGSVVLREGDPGQSFYVLARGHVEISTVREGEHKLLARLHEGAIFGEMALLSAGPRAATVTAQSDCDLLEFDCTALSNTSSTLGHLSGALASFAQERLLNNVVATSPIFRPLDPKQRQDLMRRFVTVHVEAGHVVIAEGQARQGLYVVLRGEVAVTRNDAGHGVELARLQPGEMFGEISLIHHEATTATVTGGESGADLLFLSRDYFDRLMQAVPELRAYLEKLSEDRLMDLRISMTALDPISATRSTDSDDDIEVEVML